ncbi:MAG: ATP-binding protein [Gemmatimonadetes bacterium]|nr:ATP-binding protein [Gemmatimonadota bacterium]
MEKGGILGQTRVDLLHLLEDLRDAYPESLEETILTEIVANALDSGAAHIALEADAEAATLTVTDDGRGMTRRELSRYHDLAATTKQRGRGIGFAGVGIKLGLLVCEDAVTESRRGRTHVATSWRLASRHRAPWKWIPPPGLVRDAGTAVRLRLSNPLSRLLDPGFLQSAIERHFRPLLDPDFEGILSRTYPTGVRFVVNGRAVARSSRQEGRFGLSIRLARKRKPAAVGYLRRSADPLPEDERGVAISTLGKVIKRGWDWLGVAPAAAEQVAGLVETPALAECLTLNKADFIRTGPRGATYLAYRKALQEAVTEQLTAWGDVQDTARTRRPRTRPIERELESVLVDMADEFPLLATLVERRPGGQRRLPLGSGPANAREALSAALLTVEREEHSAEIGGEAAGTGASEPDSGAVEGPPAEDGSGAQPRGSLDANAQATVMPGARGPKRPGRYGLEIRFENRTDDSELGRLVESTVWVNEAHPAFRRAAASRSEGYHIALTVAMSLAPLAVESARAHDFVTEFMARWGEAGAQDGRSKRRG